MAIGEFYGTLGLGLEDGVGLRYCRTQPGFDGLRGLVFLLLVLDGNAVVLQVLELGVRPVVLPGKLVPYRRGELSPTGILVLLLVD